MGAPAALLHPSALHPSPPIGASQFRPSMTHWNSAGKERRAVAVDGYKTIDDAPEQCGERKERRAVAVDGRAERQQTTGDATKQRADQPPHC